MLADIIPLPTQISTGDMDRAFPFDKTHYLCNRIFRRNRYHDMDMIRHDVTFLYQALLLLRQPVKYATQLLPNLPEKILPAVFRYNCNRLNFHDQQ